MFLWVKFETTYIACFLATRNFLVFLYDENFKYTLKFTVNPYAIIQIQQFTRSSHIDSISECNCS